MPKYRHHSLHTLYVSEHSFVVKLILNVSDLTRSRQFTCLQSLGGLLFTHSARYSHKLTCALYLQTRFLSSSRHVWNARLAYSLPPPNASRASSMGVMRFKHIELIPLLHRWPFMVGGLITFYGVAAAQKGMLQCQSPKARAISPRPFL